MTDPDLDQLFAQARQPSADDEQAAERFLQWRREQHSLALPEAALPSPPRSHWPLWLAAAALGFGLMVGRLPSAQQPLPAAAAYEVYQDTLGAGW